MLAGRTTNKPLNYIVELINKISCDLVQGQFWAVISASDIFNYTDAKESLLAFCGVNWCTIRLYPERLRGSLQNFEVSVLSKFPFAVYPAFTQKDFHKCSGKLHTPDDMKHNSFSPAGASGPSMINFSLLKFKWIWAPNSYY